MRAILLEKMPLVFMCVCSCNMQARIDFPDQRLNPNVQSLLIGVIPWVQAARLDSRCDFKNKHAILGQILTPSPATFHCSDGTKKVVKLVYLAYGGLLLHRRIPKWCRAAVMAPILYPSSPPSGVGGISSASLCLTINQWIPEQPFGAMSSQV